LAEENRQDQYIVEVGGDECRYTVDIGDHNLDHRFSKIAVGFFRSLYLRVGGETDRLIGNGRILLPIPMEKLYLVRPIASSWCGMEKESEGDHRVQVATSNIPSNQFERPSLLIEFSQPHRNGDGDQFKGVEIESHRLTDEIIPTITRTGATKSAICRLEPTVTETARSILSFKATLTAVACSAALPIIGRQDHPVKRVVNPNSLVASSRVLTNNSDSIATPMRHEQ
jgi:hypothetical protein